VNADGEGSTCVRDQDCSAGYLCKSFATPPNNFPTGGVCVVDIACQPGGPNLCTDPSADPHLDAACMVYATGTTGACTTKCRSGTAPNLTDTATCPFDQVATLASDGTCTCQRRHDPFGDPCTTDADCSWKTGLLGDDGPTRVCKSVSPNNKRCVPRDFCQPDETPATCHDGVDNDCDGIPEDREPVCQQRFCADRDGDGYCSASDCTMAYTAPNGYLASGCPAFPDCNDADSGEHPGQPEVCNGKDDNCDSMVAIDEGCQSWCLDADGDGWPVQSTCIKAISAPGPSWTVNGGSFEDANCDNDPSRHDCSTPPPPADGTTQACLTGDPRCPNGTQTYHNGWSACTATNCPADIFLEMTNIDHDAYAWSGVVSDNSNAICSVVGGSTRCALGDQLRALGKTGTTQVVIKIGNGDGGNSGGFLRVMSNGQAAWEHTETVLVRHTGWIYRVYLNVDLDSGAVSVTKEDGCVMWLDCMN
jgi:hypothetical protein